ncbi:Cytosolic sulfotransferase 6 [Armadillidium vulgare]|nr:Cytosolic sulfotransferase 6 [Armadillidium vulgare]
MSKRKFTQEDIESALDINSSDSEYEDDVEYDSENDDDYIAAFSSSSDEDDEFDTITSTSTRPGRHPSQRMRTSTPSPVSPSAPSTSDSTSAQAAPPAPAAPPAVKMQRRRRVRSEEYISSIVDSNVSSLKTRSDFRWHCRPQSTTSTRVSARNIMFDITPGPAHQARTADNPEKSFRQTVLLGPRRMSSITMKPLNLYLRLMKNTHLCENKRDSHPNPEGYQEIKNEDTNLEFFREYKLTRETFTRLCTTYQFMNHSQLIM